MIPPLNGAEERAQRQGQINSDVTERRVCESVQGFPEQSGDVSVAGVGECGLLSVWCLLSFPVRRGSPTGTLASTDYRALGLSRQQITCPPPSFSSVISLSSKATEEDEKESPCS